MLAKLQEGVPLAPMTTIKIGGAARYFIQPESAQDVRAAIAWARDEALPYFVLGGGSNVLIADAGFEGLVIQPRLTFLEAENSNDHVVLSVGAGVEWDSLVAHAVSLGLGGITCLSGIPGFVGAAPIQNIGAYGQEMAETLIDVQVLDLTSGELLTFANEACTFGYRDSLFKRQPGKYLVLSLRLKLKKDASAIIRYPDLQKRMTQDASLVEVRETVLAVRREKSMVVDENDANSRSCGSFFTNPIMGLAAWATLAKRAEPLQPPHFAAGEGRVKVPAAWLIEKAGFAKGFGSGAIGLSEKHTLAIVNRGGGTAAEVAAFGRQIRAGVEERFGVTLVPEPVFVGVSL